VRPEILEQLVKLVTLEPEHDAEDKVKFKSVYCVNWPTLTSGPQ
jgi:hypothetical protein